MKRLCLEPDVLQTLRVEVDSIILVVVVALIRNSWRNAVSPFVCFKHVLESIRRRLTAQTPSIVVVVRALHLPQSTEAVDVIVVITSVAVAV